MTVTEIDSGARAWVGCLGCYNGGRLRGWWLDCDSIAELPERCNVCGSDEWWVLDHELGNGFGEMSPAEFVEIVERWQQLDELDASGSYSAPLAAVLAYWDNAGWQYAPKDPHDIFRGPSDCFLFICEQNDDTHLGYAMAEFEEETGGWREDALPDWVRIDWESVGRNTWHTFNVCEMRDGGLAVFSHG